MCLFAWSEKNIKKLKWYDIGIFKLCILSATLLLAKLWPPLLSLEWYWYAIVFALTFIWLISVMRKPDKTTHTNI